MANKFLYIDDTGKDRRQATAAALSRSRVIEVESKSPLSWDKMINYFTEHINEINGLILDWRLTEEAQADGEEIKYSAESLAQELRFLVSDKSLKDIPIVLCSEQQGFAEYYRKDLTGHDLFDKVYEKIKFIDNHEVIVNQLNDIAEFYKKIQLSDEVSFQNILEIPEDLTLDVRLTDQIDTLLENKIPHELSRFLLDEVIRKPGVLIDENILAARLGIDKKGSDDWQKLMELLTEKIGYRGSFSNGWKRFWAERFVDWWKSEIHPNHPQNRVAKQRVKLLKEKTGFQNLKVAEKIKFSSENEFWTVCFATKKPLSTSDGFRILLQNEQPWQDAQYVSLYAIWERINLNTYKLNPLEKERLENYKKQIIANG